MELQHGVDSHIQVMTDLITHIQQQLDVAAPNECIHLCGLAVLRIIASEPQDVLAIAKETLNTWPYDNVPTSYRRLYEEASLHLAVQQLTHEVERRRLAVASDDTWFAQVVSTLDRGLIISGGPGRKALIYDIFDQLETMTRQEFIETAQPQHLVTIRPGKLQTTSPILRHPEPLPFEAFQLQINKSATPFIIPHSFDRWPAMQLWNDVTYLKSRALFGHRLVPVEIGSSYTDDNWSQTVIPFGEFIDTYLVPEQPTAIGYLAQHDLFAQIPSLKNDISIPDYCWTTPPQPNGYALQTSGIQNVKQLDEPLLNAWLGPAGTKTPLHTDPYHNILCQVVGYKYVRLYPPSQRSKVYPKGVDDAGIDLSNTSQVDVRYFRPAINTSRPESAATDQQALARQREQFPAFEEAEGYVEAILAPGECLYIPVGWWHYVESLTASFSVSFWWN